MTTWPAPLRNAATRVRGLLAPLVDGASTPDFDHVPEAGRAVRGHRAASFLTRPLYRVQTFGGPHVPTDGPLLLAGNHTSFIDGPLLASWSPRPLHILVKAEMFKGFFGWFLPWCGQIPIDRANGRQGLAVAVKVLRQGGAVGMFPEGTRGDGDVAQMHGGVAWLALAGKAPVVPVAILGARYPGESVHRFTPPGRRIIVAFGEPLHLPPELKGRAGVATATELIQAHLAAHVARTRDFTGIAPPALPTT